MTSVGKFANMIGVKSETVELYVWPSVVVDVMVVVKSFGGGIGSRLVSELKRRLRLKIAHWQPAVTQVTQQLEVT